MWFLMGQMEAQLGHRELSYKAYQKVIRQNPPYETEFNARIAQTEVMATGRAASRKMISRLKRMAASDNNKDYLDQVYYAIGNIYLAQNDTARAIGAYEKGNEKATRSGIEKGVLLLRLGGLYWEQEKFADAKRCYGEAIGLLDKDRPDYEELSYRSKVLDDLVPHTETIHLQDSLQELAQMSEKDRNAAIDRVIEALKKQEKEERDKAREAEVEKLQQKQGAVGNRNKRTPTSTAASQQKNGQWYFYNQMAINQGKQQFQQQWGKRENADHWRRANQTVVASLGEATAETAEPTDSLGNSLGNVETTDSLAATEPTETPDKKDEAAADSAQNDPHKREFYLAQIPFTEEQVAESNLLIMEALLQSGIIFKDRLDLLNLSEKQLARLSTQYPDYEKMDLALYHLFLLYSRTGRNIEAANCLERMKSDYAESEWTVLLSDPLFEENARFGEHIEDSLYGATYEAFKKSRYDEVKANAKLSEERFPMGDNRPKFLFIDGLSLLNEGDATGCVERLKTVVEKYPQSEVTEMAGMIIKGVQEGRTLHGGQFDLDDIWSRRDLTLANDSNSNDTLSAERNTPFVFILAYQPDSLYAGSDRTSTQKENQLLFELARYNFTNFMVRNFDLQIERQGGISRITVSGFLSYDEALQYARQLYSSTDLQTVLRPCRRIVISEVNLRLIGTRYSYNDYEEYYERTFMPLEISNEELLQIPEEVTPTPEEEDTDDTQDDDRQQAPKSTGDFDLDDLFD
jgi:tetratricopeptide (TPR) repeat protein